MSTIITTPPPVWRSITDIRKSTLDYIIHRNAGMVKSIKTPWTKLNNALLGGLEWGGVYVIAARPGVGKTAMMNQITSSAPALNVGQDFATLNFQFEMSDKMMGARELTSHMQMDLKTLFSAEGAPPLTNEDIKRIVEFHMNRANEQSYTIDKTRTAAQFKSDVLSFYKFIKKPIIVTLDHSLLIKRDGSEKDQLESLYALASAIVDLKKIIPDAIFIILTQMNREIEKVERRKDSSIGNYPTSGDIFGADALMQNCDVTIALNRPAQLGIHFYGDKKYVVNPSMIVAHLLKNRYGELGMLFLTEDLKHFQLKETLLPPMTK